MNPFLTWMKNAAKDEKEEAARIAETASHQMRLIVYEMEGKPHGRVPSSELAHRIVKGLRAINARKRHKALPDVTVGDINPTCRDCEYFRKCKK